MTADTRALAARCLDYDQWRAYEAMETLTSAEHMLLVYRLAMAEPRLTLAHIEQMRRGS